jgi:uncharacterized protein YndB with AHSA1/START domain
MTQQTARELNITRQFNASIDRVWRALTVPEEYAKWLAPEGFTVSHCELDVRVGGKALVCMRSESGDEIWSGGEYLEVDPPRRLVISDYFTDEQGNRVSATRYGVPGEWPENCQIELTLTENDGTTTLRMRQGPLPEGMAEGASAGWNSSLDKLAALVEGGNA